MRHHRHTPEQEQRAATASISAKSSIRDVWSTNRGAENRFVCVCQIFMLLFFLMIVAQMLLVYWKKKHYRSYQQVTTFGHTF